jgi:hypothetical protein
MHGYDFRYYHLDGYLMHRVSRACADLADALAWAEETFTEEHAMLEILEDDTSVWRGTPAQARDDLDARHAA